jgi:general stress protein 26
MTMTSRLTRRTVVTAVPALGLAGLLPGCAAGRSVAGRTAAAAGVPGGLYRVDDEAAILAAARAMVAEDRIASLVTIDSDGVPRVRPVGVSPPEDGLVFWIGTRPATRKVHQIRDNPNATLLFNFDDAAGNYENAFYVSFMGTATVHMDMATLAARRPSAEQIRMFWPDFPRDYAAIRFRPRWLEVYGKGIEADPSSWQPQAAVLRDERAQSP